MTTKSLMTFAMLTLSLAGCSSTAALVRKDAAGGRVELSGAYMPAMADARMLMVEHCGGRFAALELGDHVEFRCQVAEAAPAGTVVARAGK